LVQDDNITCAINEERIVRKKLIGGFPYKSVEQALEQSKLTFSEVDKIIVGGILTPPWFARLFRGLQRTEYDVRSKTRKNLKNFISDVAQFKFFIHVTKPNSFFGRFQQKFISRIFKKDLPANLKNKKLIFIDHHYAHAASAYYTQEKNEVLAITIDGCGDGLSMTINHCKDGNIIK